MSTPEFRIADDLALPAEAVTQTFLILGMRGSGKTNTGVVMAEGMIGAGLPTCIIDPTGVWWGLRSSADGQGPGLPVTIIGGEHADLPLPPGGGALLADLVVDERLPVVLDLSLLSKTQQRRFVTDFLERLYHRNREPLHLIVDEADLFAPQRATGEIARLLGAYEDIVRRGRAKGIGCTSITQRPAGMHTDVRSQAAVLIALRLIGRHDIVAIDDWVRLHASDEDARELKASLPSMRTGMAWVWSPEWLEVLQQIQVRPRRTFDSSATPKVGEKRIVPRAFARVDQADLQRLAARLEPGEPAADHAPKVATNAEVKRLRSDLATVRAENAALRRELAEAQARPAEHMEVPVLQPGDTAAVEQIITALRAEAGSLELALGRAGHAMPKVAPVPAPVHKPPAGPLPLAQAAEPTAPDTAPGPLSKAQRAVLTVLAQFPEGRTRSQVATLSGYSAKSSSMDNALSALRVAGLIRRGSPIQITDAGFAALGDTWEPLPAGAALVEHWMGRLGKAERAVLRALLEAWPESLTRDQIAEASGYSAKSSSMDNALSRLRTLELITGRGDLRADETLAQHAHGVTR